MAGRLVDDLTAVDGPTGTIHGSFHDDQVLVGETGVTLVDLDSVQRGPLHADVGHFLSYLSADGAEDAREGFLAAYARRAAIGPAVLLFEAASLLRWSTLPFRELEPGLARGRGGSRRAGGGAPRRLPVEPRRARPVS